MHVVTGPLLTVCLDGTAVQSLAEAWARARVEGASDLPLHGIQPDPPKYLPLPDGRGYAAPLANAVTEGRSRWEVTPPEQYRPYLTVSSHWLTIRVHDRTALDIHIRAWAQAQDLALRLMRGSSITFKDMTTEARAQRMSRHDRLEGPEPDAGRSR